MSMFDFAAPDPYARNTSGGGILSIEVDDITPDPNQPRTDLLPPDLREKFFSENVHPFAILNEWEAQNRGSDEKDEKWVRLAGLAQSILKMGQLQPITVREVANGKYTIVIGERRWWAHQLLLLWRQIETTTISAIIYDNENEAAAILAAQLAENMARDDMSPIDKARALQELKQFYTTWKDVEEVVGISRQHRLRLMKLLNLGNDAQTAMMASGTSERAIRPIMQQLDGEVRDEAIIRVTSGEPTDDVLKDYLPADQEQMDQMPPKPQRNSLSDSGNAREEAVYDDQGFDSQPKSSKLANSVMKLVSQLETINMAHLSDKDIDALYQLKSTIDDLLE